MTIFHYLKILLLQQYVIMCMFFYCSNQSLCEYCFIMIISQFIIMILLQQFLIILK